MDKLPIIIKGEITNLKIEISDVTTELSTSLESKTIFFRNPFKFLSEKFKIIFVNKYIVKFKKIIKDFNSSVKKFYKKIKGTIDTCFACGLATIILIYGLLAQVGFGLEHIPHIMHIVIDGLEELLDKKVKGKDEFLKKLRIFSPGYLARKYCEFFQICTSNDKPNIVTVDIGKSIKRSKPIYDPVPA